MVVRRILVKGLTVVSELGPSQATQTGVQQFYMKMNGQPEQMVEDSHFSRIWTKENGEWKITRELDYQINNPSPQDASKTAEALYKEVTGADSALFAAYNNRDIATMKNIFSTDLEFYHDKGGLANYADNIANFKKHFDDLSSTSRRDLVKGSVEVYPLNNYGAIEIGIHKFYTKTNGKENLDATAKFINVWHQINGQWKLARVISFDHK